MTRKNKRKPAILSIKYDGRAINAFERFKESLVDLGWNLCGGGQSTAYFRNPDAKLFITVDNGVHLTIQDAPDVFGEQCTKNGSPLI